jgi:hypothetical protein
VATTIVMNICAGYAHAFYAPKKMPVIEEWPLFDSDLLSCDIAR